MKRDTYRRFAYIETCLYWGLGITATQLGKVFTIARQNAQACLDAYRKQYPASMEYDPRQKRHKATTDFQPCYIKADPENYLHYLRGNQLSNAFWEDEEWEGLPVVDVDTLFRPYLDRDCVRLLMIAIQHRQVVTIYYHSKARTHYLTISPNNLVFASRRYHVRAYCHDWQRYIDVVLSRVLEANVSNEDWVSEEEDKDWISYIDLYFQPNPDLPAQMIDTLKTDFRLQSNRHMIRTRVALRGYVLREMERIDWKYNMKLWLPA